MALYVLGLAATGWACGEWLIPFCWLGVGIVSAGAVFAVVYELWTGRELGSVL